MQQGYPCGLVGEQVGALTCRCKGSAHKHHCGSIGGRQRMGRSECNRVSRSELIGCLQVQHTELVEDKLIDADTALVGMDERGEQTCRHGFKLM